MRHFLKHCVFKLFCGIWREILTGIPRDNSRQLLLIIIRHPPILREIQPPAVNLGTFTSPDLRCAEPIHLVGRAVVSAHRKPDPIRIGAPGLHPVAGGVEQGHNIPVRHAQLGEHHPQQIADLGDGPGDPALRGNPVLRLTCEMFLHHIGPAPRRGHVVTVILRDLADLLLGHPGINPVHNRVERPAKLAREHGPESGVAHGFVERHLLGTGFKRHPGTGRTLGDAFRHQMHAAPGEIPFHRTACRRLGSDPVAAELRGDVGGAVVPHHIGRKRAGLEEGLHRRLRLGDHARGHGRGGGGGPFGERHVHAHHGFGGGHVAEFGSGFFAGAHPLVDQAEHVIGPAHVEPFLAEGLGHGVHRAGLVVE